MSFIGHDSKQAQKLQIGPQRLNVVGLGPNAVVYVQTEDTGSVVGGVAGGGTLESSDVDTFTLTVELLQQSPSIDDFYDLHNTIRVIPVAFELGRANVSGWVVVQNFGELSGAKGSQVRTITLAGVRTTGGRTGSGQILSTV